MALLPVATMGCAIGHYYGSISGRVVDKETGQPLEGAAVVAVYNTSIASAGGEVIDYADSQEAKTGTQGEFTVPSIFVFRPRLGIGFFVGKPDIYVAKPGYGEYGYHPDADRTCNETFSPICVYALPRLKTDGERLRWSGWEPLGTEARSKLNHFLSLYNEERAHLNLKPLMQDTQ